MLSLPNELLSQTFKYNLSQNDLASLCLVHRQVYQSAREQLYREIHLQGEISLHLLARSINLNPFLASIIKKVISTPILLKDDSASRPKEYPEPSKSLLNRFKYPFEPMQGENILHKLLESPKTVAFEEKPNELPFPRSFQDTAVSLFQLLPRLHTLELCHDIFLEYLGLDVPEIVRVFPALHTFTYGSEAYTRPMDVESLITILSVPTIRTITVWHLETDARTSPIPTDLTSWYGSSPIETIRIYHASINFRRLGEIFKLPKCLRDFQCCGVVTFPMGFRSLHLREFGLTIGHASRNLERLVIHWDYAGTQMLIDSLQDYSCLKKLVIPPHIIFGKFYSSSITFEGVLPRTLDHLSLITSLHWSVSDHVAIIRRIIGQKPEHYPELSVIVLRVTNGTVAEMQTLREVASKAEVRLGMANSNNPDQFQVIPLENLRDDVDAYFYNAFRQNPRYDTGHY